MKYKMEFDMDNAAFEENGIANECFAVLTQAVNQVLSGMITGKLRDTNGNAVGEWKITGNFDADF